MAESDVVSRLSATFAPYIKSPDQLHDIRIQIAKYVESLSTQDDSEPGFEKPLSIPNHVTGIRRQYLKTLHANVTAKQDYARLRNEVQSQTSSLSQPVEPCKTLHTHLELLRLHRQYERYQILLHYAAEAGKLAEQGHIYETNPATNLQISSHETASQSAERSALVAQVQDLTKKLEVAVLQAHHQLIHDRQVLSRIKSQSPESESVSPGVKLHALRVTNAALTQWIEESLAKCDTANGTGDNHDHEADVSGDDTVQHHQVIKEHYERYLESRKRLLDTASTLSAPLPPITPTDSSQNQNTSRVIYAADMSAQSQPNVPIIPFVTSQHLGVVNQNRVLTQGQNHIDDILTTHRQDLSEQLLRLSDESHLLPSYPILAKSKKADQQVGETERLLGAWKFAMEAAGTATTAGVEKQVRAGMRAVDEVNASLEEQEEVNSTWKHLQMS